MVGFPGSGKTTYAKEKLGKYKIISGDVIKSGKRVSRTLSQVLTEAKQELTKKESIVIDRTNLNPDARKQIIDLAKKFDAEVTCLVFKEFSRIVRYLW